MRHELKSGYKVEGTVKASFVYQLIVLTEESDSRGRTGWQKQLIRNIKNCWLSSTGRTVRRRLNSGWEKFQNSA